MFYLAAQNLVTWNNSRLENKNIWAFPVSKENQRHVMKIVCIGGGPGGLYFAISMKLRNPEHEIAVAELNKPHDTFGWSIVFSD